MVTLNPKAVEENIKGEPVRGALACSFSGDGGTDSNAWIGSASKNSCAKMKGDVPIVWVEDIRLLPHGEW
jgi:hypothetical protein